MRRKILMSGLPGSWQEDVLNPGVVADEDGTVHILFRGVRTGNISNIGYAKASGGKLLERSDEPIIKCGLSDHNKVGVEDPRITRIDKTYHVLCTAYDGCVSRIEMFTGESLTSLKSGGIISPCITLGEAIECVGQSKYRQSLEELLKFHDKNCIVPDKDGVIFPEKIGGKYVGLRRTNPGIQRFFFSSFEDLKDPEYWREHFRNIDSNEVLWPRQDAIKVGAGAPPIKVGDVWLLFFHEVTMDGNSRLYTTHAAVLDARLKLIERTQSPLCEPTLDCEKKGTVPNVIFTTGAVELKDRIDLYSGGADSTIVYEPIKKSYLSKVLPSLTWPVQIVS